MCSISFYLFNFFYTSPLCLEIDFHLARTLDPLMSKGRHGQDSCVAGRAGGEEAAEPW